MEQNKNMPSQSGLRTVLIVLEVLFIVFLALYVVGLVDRGPLMTRIMSYGLLAEGLATAVVAFLRKKWKLGLVNLIIALVGFAVYLILNRFMF